MNELLAKENTMNKAVFTALFLCLSLPIFSYAMPTNLACKLIGAHGSAQMSSQTVNQNGKAKTFLSFSSPIAWYPDLLNFELVYSSGYDLNQPLTVVGNAIASNGTAQTVQIILAVPSAGAPSTRYGTVRAGDFLENWYSTTGKYKTYDIQCYNF